MTTDRAQRESAFTPGLTCGQVAQRMLDRLVERASERTDEPIDESDVYAVEELRAKEYMIAGGGPTAYVTFVLDADGEVDLAVLDYVEGDGRAQATLTGHWAERLYEAFREAERDS